jgi:hypothetical protein
MNGMSDAEAKDKQIDAGLIHQAAERIGRPLLEDELAHLSIEDRERIAAALVKAANAGWNLCVQRRELEIEANKTNGE